MRLRVHDDGRIAANFGRGWELFMLGSADVALDGPGWHEAVMSDETRAGADDTPRDPNAVPTPGQWVAAFLDGNAEKRLAMARRAIADADVADRVRAAEASGDQVKAAAAAIDPERVAQTFHEAYEALAPSYGYETREESAKPWRSVPQQNRELMTETARAVMHRLSLVARPNAATLREQIWDAVDDELSAYRPLGAPTGPGQITDAVMAVLAEHGLIDNNDTTGDET